MADEKVRYSRAAAAAEVANIQGPVAATMTWDAYCRLMYERTNSAIQRQANELVQRGNISMEEARDLVEVQRNGLVAQIRNRLSPFGRFYSEALKPTSALPTLEAKLAEKGTLEAVLVSVGKSRAVTNKMAFVWRRAGPVGIVIEIVAVAVVIEKAPPGQRAGVAFEEVSGAAGGIGGGTLGMWGGAAAGAAWAGTWASPTLLIPVVGEITEGTAILLGGIVGGLFFGWVGHDATKAIAHDLWKLLPIEWKTST